MKLPPQTLYERVQRLNKRGYIIMPTEEQMKNAGKEIVQLFIDTCKAPKPLAMLHKKPVVVNNEPMKVLQYPSFFVPRLDAYLVQNFKK